MEGNMNQYISVLSTSSDHEAQHNNRRPSQARNSYLAEEEDLTDIEDQDDIESRDDSERISEQTSLASRVPLFPLPEGPALSGHECRDLCNAMRSLEKTISSHGPLHRNKHRTKNVVKPDPSGLHPDPSRNIHIGKQDETMPPGQTHFRNHQDETMPSQSHFHPHQVTTYIRVVFLKIGEIDTLKETFSADTYVQAKWREPALDGMMELYGSLQNIEEIQWDKYWNPKILIENNLGDPKESVWQTLTFNKKGEASVYERRRIKGVFLENLELDEFPFDTQDLTVTITSERSEQELALEEDSSEISSINVQSFVDEQEWKLHSHVETWKRVTTKIYQNSKYKHPAISSSCRASRRPGFFIWNIFLVMLFICSLCFTTFTVDLTLPQNRLQLSFILLLTTITFKFVVSQTLPRISYLTYLDKYILTSMGILCVVCVWHSIVPMLAYNPSLAQTADRCALVILGSAYFMFHICFFMYIYFVALKKRWKYDEKDREHKERVKKLQKKLEIENSTSFGWNSIEPPI